MNVLTVFDPPFAFSGFVVGVLVGMTGVGGGSLMTPLLILFFGVNPPTAVGTDLLFAAATKTAGTLMHGFSRNIDWRVVGLLATGSVPATIFVLCALFMLDIKSSQAHWLITLALAGVLLLTSVALLFSERILLRYAERMHASTPQHRAVLTIALGALVGILVTTTSVGAGAVGVTALLMIYPRLATVRIVGSDIAHAVPLTLLAGSGHWILGAVDWNLLFTLLIGSIPGIVVGSYFAGRTTNRALRVVLATILIAVAAKLVS